MDEADLKARNPKP